MSDTTEPQHDKAAGQLRADSLPAPVRELLAAIADSLDLPLPALTEKDERTAARITWSRTRNIRDAARLILDEGHKVARTAEWIRETTAETPVTYTPWVRFEDRADEGGAPC